MEDTPISIIGIFLASIVMFIVPLVLMADRNDDISQLIVQNETAEFVDKIIKTGQITNEDYQNYILGLESSGNSYDVEIEIKVLDPNPAQYKTNSEPQQYGENTYYTLYTTQVLDSIQKDYENNNKNNKNENYNAKLILKDGDIVSIIAKNNSKTLSQTLKSIYYTIVGDDLYIISSTGTGTVAINGAT